MEPNTTRCPSCGKDILTAAERPAFCPFCGIRLGGDASVEAPRPRDGESGCRALYADLIRLYDEYDRKKSDAAGRSSLSGTLRSLFTNQRGEKDEIGIAFYRSLQSLTEALANECEALCRREEEPACAEIIRDAVRYILLDAANGKKKNTDLFLLAAESSAGVLIPFLSDRDLTEIRSAYRHSVAKVRELPVQTKIFRIFGAEEEKRGRR